MKNQIEQISEFYGPPNPGVFYRTTCQCMSNEHNLDIELELNEGFINMIFYMNCIWCTYYNLNWIKRFWHRFKASIKLLFCGKVHLEEAFIFRGKDHIKGIINALEAGIEKLEKNNK